MPQDQLSNDLASLKIDRTSEARARRGVPGWLVWLAILGGLAAVGYFLVYPRVAGSFFTTTVETGEITKVSPAQGTVNLTSTGYVVAETSAKVAAKVSGRVAEIMIVEGQTVTAGQPIARLEDVDQKSALAGARARAAAARARTQTARATLAETKQTLAREKELVARGVSPKATAEDLEARVESLAAAVRAAEAEAAAADAEAKTLEVQLASYVVTAPVNGTIVDKTAEVGELVGPGSAAPLVELVDMDSLVVEVDVPEGRLGRIKAGNPCEVILDAFPDERQACTVKEVGRRVNRAKATVPVKVKFDQRPEGAIPDMAARVNFTEKKVEKELLTAPAKLVVPVDAVVAKGDQEVIWVVEDGRVHSVAVSVGGEFGGGRELLKPALDAGTKVVLKPSASLTDGQKVKEKNL